jgi:hydroxymethylpyrimidine/phosphomethylpyrimidine kinase
MVSSGGTRLLDPEALAALREELLPLAAVLTPNLAEAGTLLGEEVRDLEGMRQAARALHGGPGGGPRWVLVKGGHLPGPAVDVLFDGASFTELAGERLAEPGGGGLHGTGCVLSAAIAAHLARGASVPAAVRAAQAHAAGAIRHARDAGTGGWVDAAWNVRRPEGGAQPAGGSSR